MDKPSFEESLRELLARRLAAEGHLTPEALAAYQAGELAAEQHERIKDHLAICEECSRLLHELAAFEEFEPARESIAPVDAQAEASWQQLRERLGEGGEEPGGAEEARETVPAFAPPVLRPRRVPLWRRPALPWALAAGLALCVVGLGWRTGSLERRLEEMAVPQTVRVVTLDSEEETRRSGGDPPAPVHAGEDVSYDLFLASDPDAPTYPLYEVEIVPVSGGAKPRHVGRRAAEEGFLRVFLPVAPEPGSYYFQVFGIEGAKKVPISRHHFTIHPAS